MNISVVSTEALADELAKRADLLDAKGIMSWGLYTTLTKIAVIPCTDGVAVRRNANGVVEVMAIRRGTGVFKGRLCSVGGRLLRGESFEDCLRRQFRNDLGCEIEFLVPWNKPVVVGQFYPLEQPLTEEPPVGFGSEDRKHCISNYYPVRLIGDSMTLGNTRHGGQEALAVEWYSILNIPSKEQFAYGQGPYFLECLMAAEKLI